MEAHDISRALVPLPGQAAYVESRFWRKVRRTLGHVPFLDRAIAAYYAAVDPATPSYAKALLMAALAYFVMPADMIPDVIVGLGFTDDATVLMVALKTLAPHIRTSHVERARAFLAERA